MQNAENPRRTKRSARKASQLAQGNESRQHRVYHVDTYSSDEEQGIKKNKLSQDEGQAGNDVVRSIEKDAQQNPRLRII